MTTIAETTLDAANGGFWSFYNPHSANGLTIPPGALAVVVSANQNLHAGNAFTVADSGAHDWERLTPYTPNADHLVIDCWYNDTGLPVTTDVTLAFVNGDGFNDSILSWVGVISDTVDPAVTPPRIAAILANASTAEASATPSHLNSLLCLHYFQNNPSADISALDPDSATDTAPAGHFRLTGGPCSIGTIYQTAPNTQIAAPVTVGAAAPVNAQTFGFLVEYFSPSIPPPASGLAGSVGGHITPLRGSVVHPAAPALIGNIT